MKGGIIGVCVTPATNKTTGMGRIGKFVKIEEEGEAVYQNATKSQQTQNKTTKMALEIKQMNQMHGIGQHAMVEGCRQNAIYKRRHAKYMSLQ